MRRDGTEDGSTAPRSAHECLKNSLALVEPSLLTPTYDCPSAVAWDGSSSAPTSSVKARLKFSNGEL